ncbi:hypothetical protein CALCODRAFT_515091 [Calocera cornea HHB12733]|uniref:Hydrophobin n=1 Tax=Calocera cornea HHB12733 TaxID=1353952 RepID=A0A165IU30_9BASI|nr:hypothetical protein CALCODRAFT_515091 [Calocera cornea HHB12733]
MHIAAVIAAIVLAVVVDASSFIARQATNPNNTVSCGLADLQCCSAVSLASAPIVANALGMEGMTIPDPNEIVGLNCTDIGSIPADETIQQVCPSLIACCAQTGLGNSGSVSEDCTFPTDIPTSEMFRGPAWFRGPEVLRKRDRWRGDWEERRPWDERDEEAHSEHSWGYMGSAPSTFAWNNDRGWVPDDHWGMDLPLLFHVPEDDGLPPIDFSLRLASSSQPAASGRPAPHSTPPLPMFRRRHWDTEEEVQLNRKRRPMQWRTSGT